MRKRESRWLHMFQKGSEIAGDRSISKEIERTMQRVRQCAVKSEESDTLQLEFAQQRLAGGTS